ncbi:MAG: FAD-dependent thymidylate synthase [Armatimonadota bacterium]
MNVTHVALRPTEAALAAGRPALTPELLAASGARYSRNNEGLDAILARVDFEHPDQAVDGIFRMVDYGHQSIADMAPIAIFIDGVSLWLAYFLWALSPTAGGQESSTRYIKIDVEGLIEPETLGIPAELQGEWRARMAAAFDAYRAALECWTAKAEADPETMRIPRCLLDDPSEKAQKQVERMRRNYAFDRARYFLPTAAATNVMLVMSARGWVNLCQHLLSHALPEAQALGTALREELALSAPRLLRHAVAKESITRGLQEEFRALQAQAAGPTPYLQPDAPRFDHPPTPYLEVCPPAGTTGEILAADLKFHDNRYAWMGGTLKRTAVRFGWEAVTFGEIRDLNRHRTGSKYCPPLPVGFYAAQDQLGKAGTGINFRKSVGNCTSPRFSDLCETGRAISARARGLLAAGDPSYLYWTLLGTQFPFEHVTTADKFLYEGELRTGAGAHYRYARHLHDALELWYAKYPETRGLVLEGSAEPE